MYLKANVDDGGRRTTLETYPLITKAHARIQEFSSFFKVPEGVQHFPGGGGVQLFSGVGPIAYSL